MTPRPALAATALLGAAALLVPPAPASTAQAALCRGEVATIVGDGSRSDLAGTSGDDVIVTNGAGRVESFGGDDTICVTASVQSVRVLSGPGDDVVDRSADTLLGSYAVRVDLGTGSDEYHGNADAEMVRAFGGAGDDPDVVLAATGEDQVVVGSVGGLSRDTVATGADSLISVVGGIGSGASYTAGPSSVFKLVAIHGADTWDVDVQRGEVRYGDQVRATIAGFNRFIIDGVRTSTSVHVNGTSASEEVVAISGRIGATLWGGDDQFTRDEDHPSRSTPCQEVGAGAVPVVRGGTGVDEYTTGCDRGDYVNLSKGIARALVTGARPLARLVGFENVDARQGTARLTGNGSPNRLRSFSCRARLAGGGGDDRLERYIDIRPGDLDCPSTSVWRMYGGDGDDTMIAFYAIARTEMFGGAGDDRAYGSPDGGVSFCEAELRRNCRRP